MGYLTKVFAIWRTKVKIIPGLMVMKNKYLPDSLG
jgi:hypothetical protein